jgi:hypothetical protein
MILILIFLVFNFLIARLLASLTYRLSALYIENSKVFAPLLRKDMYDLYLKIYQTPSCLDNMLLMHIPLYNLNECFFVYMAILNVKEKLKK